MVVVHKQVRKAADSGVACEEIVSPSKSVSDPQIVILGVAGSSPVSHPFPFGSAGPCVADVRLDESSDAYHGDTEYLNCSSGKTAADSISLYHARHVARSLPQQTSDAMTHGSLLHGWLQHGDPVLDTWAVPPEEMLTATGLFGKEGKKWVLENFGPTATVVSPKEFAQVRLEIAAIKANRAACELIEGGVVREASVRWTNADGDKLRCRFDMVSVTDTGAYVVDLKTTRESNIAKTFWRAVLDYKYHLSDAWYQRGMEACGIEPAPLRYIVVSTVPPHDCQVVTLPAAVIDEGRNLMDTVLADLRIRRGLDWWLPDHHGEVIELSFPAYALGRNQ